MLSVMYPMRINKYLAMKGYATRRGADDLIEQKAVTINGRLAVLGDKVQESDSVVVRGHAKQKKYLYFAYNKPIGIITHSPQSGEKDIKQKISRSPIPKEVFPVGRLDKNSHGLIILTNDGRITDRLLNPEREHEKEYAVRTVSKLRASFKQSMEKGVNIEGYTTKKCTVAVKSDFEFTIKLTEGKKHQIRRMVVAMHNDVTDLKRIRIMNIKLGNLGEGLYRPIEGEELETFLTSIGL